MNRLKRARQTFAMLVFAAILWPSAFGFAGEPPRIIAGPMFTGTPRGVVVWVQTDSDGHLSLIRPSGPSPILLEGIHPKDSPTHAGQKDRHIFTGLIPTSPGQTQQVELNFTNEAGLRLAEPIQCRLKPPAEPGRAGRYKIAFGSCSHQEKFAEKQPIWSAIADEQPDCFLFIGDNMYLPSDPAAYPKTRDEVFKLYCDTYDRERRLPDMQRLLRSTVSYAIWDDHDYGPNNADRHWTWKDVALEALQTYFPNDYGLPDAPGCYYQFSWGDIDVFMLDDRTHRDPNLDPESASKTMFGEKQLAWLKGGLSASSATFKLVVNGNQMISDTHPHESWGVQFRPERDAFLRWLWDERIQGVIFLAGDRHFAELVRRKDPKGKGDDLWELTSSPLANDTFKQGDKIPNGDRVRSYTTGPNFGLLRFDTTATPPTVELVLKRQDGKTEFKQKIEARDTAPLLIRKP